MGGGESGNPGVFRCGKGTTWDGGMHVPGLFHWRNTIKPGDGYQLATTLDILPTILKLVGHPESVDSHGMDITEMLLDPKKVRTDNRIRFIGFYS